MSSVVTVLPLLSPSLSPLFLPLAPFFCSLESLNLPDRDPTGLAVSSDGYAVVATKKEVVVAHNSLRVSSFAPSYQPCTVAINKSNNEVVIGGTVRQKLSGYFIFMRLRRFIV